MPVEITGTEAYARVEFTIAGAPTLRDEMHDFNFSPRRVVVHFEGDGRIESIRLHGPHIREDGQTARSHLGLLEASHHTAADLMAAHPFVAELVEAAIIEATSIFSQDATTLDAPPMDQLDIPYLPFPALGHDEGEALARTPMMELDEAIALLAVADATAEASLTGHDVVREVAERGTVAVPVGELTDAERAALGISEAPNESGSTDYVDVQTGDVIEGDVYIPRELLGPAR